MDGWALRFAGGKDCEQLLKFLDKHAATMPRAPWNTSTKSNENMTWASKQKGGPR
jgi:hypothetical protein